MGPSGRSPPPFQLIERLAAAPTRRFRGLSTFRHNWMTRRQYFCAGNNSRAAAATMKRELSKSALLHKLQAKHLDAADRYFEKKQSKAAQFDVRANRALRVYAKRAAEESCA